jgi:signal transduction histidine kinase/CheY-like chemotaxis protein
LFAAPVLAAVMLAAVAEEPATPARTTSLPEPGQRLDDVPRIGSTRDGHLVGVADGVLGAARVGSVLVLVMQGGPAVSLVQLAGSLHSIARGPEVLPAGAHGVRYHERGLGRFLNPPARDGDDLAAHRSESSITASQVLTIAAVLAAIALAIGVWGMALRRRVRRQTEQLRNQLERESRLQRELERAQRLESLGYLAGGIAHDFNNLLTVVLGNISLARSDAGVKPEHRESLDEAMRAIMRTRELTQQLLTFSKGGAPIRASTDLAAVVREAAEFALPDSPVRPEFRIAPELWPADIDRGQISQVVQNIVRFGACSMPEGGRLEIELGNDAVMADDATGIAPGRYLRLIIRDHGHGISAEDIPRIFDPYFSIQSQIGSLGLATAYSILKRHGGRIVVDSTVGRGSCFRVWLPAVRAGARPAARAVPAVERSEKRLPAKAAVAAAAPVGEVPVAPGPAVKGAVRVLVMDDEGPILRLAQTVLQRAGYDVTAVGDGAEAVREYVQARERGAGFALVILDLTVPGGMGGREALEELHRIDPAVRAIVSSGYSNDPSPAGQREPAFAAVVPKPYEGAALVATVRAVLGGSAA